VEGDPSPDGKGRLVIKRGIEVGHIFQLGNKYSTAMKATALDESGRQKVLEMGCYGIGVSRVVAAAIEQNHDERGIVWPSAIAPFQVALLPMNMHKSQRVREAAEALYQQLTDAGVEVLFDDRKERAGVMFADMELIGIPHRLVLGERGLDADKIEYKGRRDRESQETRTARQADPGNPGERQLQRSLCGGGMAGGHVETVGVPHSGPGRTARTAAAGPSGGHARRSVPRTGAGGHPGRECLRSLGHLPRGCAGADADHALLAEGEYYLDKERGNLTRALARYNGSLHIQPNRYASLVYRAWDRNWFVR